MDWLYSLWAEIRKHRVWGLVIAAVLLLAAVGSIIRGLDRIKQTLVDLILPALVIDPTPTVIHIKDGYAWGALLTLLILLILFLLGLRVWLELRRVREDVERQGTEGNRRSYVLDKTFERMMQAASQIFAQLYSTSGQPQKNLLRARRTYIVSENFDTAVLREDEYKAITDLHIEQITIGAETAANPCEFLDDIDFKVRDENPLNQVVYVPCKNTPFEKSVILFFLPHISPQEPTARRITVSYKWPKMMRQLETKGFEIGDWILKSRDPIPSAEMRLFFAPALKPKINVTIQGARIQKESLTPAMCDVPGCGNWCGWSYALENAPPGLYQIKIEMLRSA